MLRAIIVPFKVHTKITLLYVSACTFLDIKGNQMNLPDHPKYCGYSVREGKAGKIYLRVQLHSHCHMIVQASIDSDFTLST